MTRSSDTIQEELLVLDAQDGDCAALDALLKLWLPIMRRHSSRLTGDAAASEDVTQEACVAIVSGLSKLDDPARARGWMLRIVTHKAADWVRRRQHDRQLKQSIKDREPRSASNDFKSETSPEDRASLIRAACLELPIELRAVVSLYYGEGLSIAAIAAAVAIPPGTVKSRLHEARSRLKTILERNEP